MLPMKKWRIVGEPHTTDGPRLYATNELKQKVLVNSWQLDLAVEAYQSGKKPMVVNCKLRDGMADAQVYLMLPIRYVESEATGWRGRQPKAR